MSDIYLLYNGQKKKIKAPETMSALQSEFLKEFNEDITKEFIYFYNDKGEEIDIEKCSNFNEIIDSIKSMEEPIIKIKKRGETFNLAVNEETVEKDEDNSDALDPVRSGQVFTKPKKEEKNVKLESNNSETIISNNDSSNVNIEVENTEITKSIVTNNSNSNQKKQNNYNYETPRPEDSDSDDDDDDENQTPTGDEKPKYHPNKNVQKEVKKVVKIEENVKKVEKSKENEKKCDSSTQKPPSQVITCSNSNPSTKSDKINQNVKSGITSTQNNNKKNENIDSIEELRKKLKELEKFKEKSQENNRSMAKKNLELSKNLQKERKENEKLKKLLDAKNPSNGNDEELEKIKKEYESKMEESNKKIEEIENEKKSIESKYEEINKQFLEEKEKNKKLYKECEKIKAQINADNEYKKKEEEEKNISLNCTKKEDEEKNKLKNKIKEYKEKLAQAKNTISKLQNDISNMNSNIANIQLSPSSNLKLNNEEEEINNAREDKKKSENNRNDKNLHLSKIYKKKAKNSKEENSSRLLKEAIEQIKIQEDDMKNKIIQNSKLKLNKIKIPKKNSPNKSDNKMNEKLSLLEKENSELKQTIDKLKIEINNKIDIINNLSNSNNNKNGDFGNQKQLIKEICEKIILEKSEALIKKELFTIENTMNKKIEKTTQDMKNNYNLKYDKFENEMKRKFWGGKIKNDIPHLNNQVESSDHELFLFKSNINIDNNDKINDSIKKFSYECLNIINLSSYIYQGTDEVKMSIIMKNNCNEVWPEGDTKLVLDNDSKIPIDDIVLLPQKPNEQNSYEFTIKNLSSYSPGEYSSYMLFKADGQIFGDKLQIKIIVRPKKNDEEIEKYKDKINEFREMFDLDILDFPDEKLLEALKNHDFDYEQAFSDLFE